MDKSMCLINFSSIVLFLNTIIQCSVNFYGLHTSLHIYYRHWLAGADDVNGIMN